MPAQEDEKTTSVLDILYADLRRISTFEAQFHEFGNLTSIAHTRSARRGKQDDTTYGAGGSAFFARGSASNKHSYEASHDEGSERFYDPVWSNTLAFLDEADSRNMIHKDINQAKMGDIVLINGPIRFRDLKLMEKIWKLPSVRKLVEAGANQKSNQQSNRQERRRSERKSQNSSNDHPSEIDLIFEMIGVLPHSLQAEVGVEPTAWAVLDEDFLITQSSDLVLKYGSSIPGEWTMVGILDAIPDEIREGELVENTPLEQITDVMLSHVEPILRQFVGRPSTRFGLTPLLIFRETGSEP